MFFSCNELNHFKEYDNFVKCNTKYLKPLHIVMASAYHNYLNKKVIFEYKEAEDYALNMWYDNPVEIDSIGGKYHTKAIKLNKEHIENDSQAYKIIDILKKNNYLNEETIETFAIILAEIFQNFYAHANVKQPPICCVQDWKSNDFMEIAVIDTGIGIGKSLEGIISKDKNPCKEACKSGITSKKGKNHSGYGLFFTKRFFEENKGKFYLISDKFCYIIDNDSEEERELDVKWNGTIIRMVLNKKSIINAEEFFKMITKEQGDEEEYF